MLKGPSPDAPRPPRTQVVTHLPVQISAFLDLGLWILYLFLQSFSPGVHTLDNVCGMLDSVSSGCDGAATSMAPADHTKAAAAAAATATAIALPAVKRVEGREIAGALRGES